MAGDVTVMVHFKGLNEHAELQESIDKRCRHLAEEFAETNSYEVSIVTDASDFTANAKVTGKQTSVSSHATAPDPRQAADAALDRLERELRKDHDKRIFAPRREARRAKARRPG